jgi:glycosyltransferase involved in cell wall biosynthesis
MNAQSSPLVSVLTPVYNDAEYLAECIESVLAQTYTNWDYTILNNCSTDESLSIVRKYAAKDSRIRVVDCEQFLRIIPNHNRALRHISPDCKYCKFVFADDWLFPNCLEEMVATAERHPSIGLVSAYALGGERVLCTGLAYPSSKVSGREICRRKLLGGPDVFGAPTAQLIRADLVRERPAFYRESNLHSDTEACLDVLQESDFGFVHQVLTYSRPRENSVTSFATYFDSGILGMLVTFLKYGPVFLDEDEYRSCLNQRLKRYHRVLAKSVLRFRSRDYWSYHRETLAAVDAKIRPWLLMESVIVELLKAMAKPIAAVEAALRWWPEALSRLSGARQTVARR